MEMVAHQGEAQNIHAIEDLQALDQVQETGLIHIVDGQAGQSSPGNDMIYRTLGISDKTGYAGHKGSSVGLLLSDNELTLAKGSQIVKYSLSLYSASNLIRIAGRYKE
jgi:hypothetical protein